MQPAQLQNAVYIGTVPCLKHEICPSPFSEEKKQQPVNVFRVFIASM